MTYLVTKEGDGFSAEILCESPTLKSARQSILDDVKECTLCEEYQNNYTIYKRIELHEVSNETQIKTTTKKTVFK